MSYCEYCSSLSSLSPFRTFQLKVLNGNENFFILRASNFLTSKPNWYIIYNFVHPLCCDFTSFWILDVDEKFPISFVCMGLSKASGLTRRLSPFSKRSDNEYQKRYLKCQYFACLRCWDGVHLYRWHCRNVLMINSYTVEEFSERSFRSISTIIYRAV